MADNEKKLPEQYRSAQFAEIGSVRELTGGGGGSSTDNDSTCIPANGSCRWDDEPDEV